MKLLKRQQIVKLTMRFLSMFAGFLFLAFASACGPSTFNPAKTQQELIKNATANIPYVKEFHEMFPSAQIGVFSDSFKKDTTKTQMSDIVYDRYQLTLTIHFEVNRKLEVTSYASPSITMVEITSIEGNAEGPLKERYGTNYKISEAQWRKVVEAGGQFSATGLDVKTNEPVAGIEKLKTYLHRPPIQ